MTEQNFVDRLNEKTEGGLYALQYECKRHGWMPHLWAEPLSPLKTRIFFVAIDQAGHTRYFDHEVISDKKGLLAKAIRRNEGLRPSHTKLPETSTIN